MAGQKEKQPLQLQIDWRRKILSCFQLILWKSMSSRLNAMTGNQCISPLDTGPIPAEFTSRQGERQG